MSEAIDKALKAYRRKCKRGTAPYEAYDYILKHTQEATNKAEYIRYANRVYYRYAHANGIEAGETESLYNAYVDIRGEIELALNSPTNKTSRLGIIMRLQTIRNETSAEYETHITHAMNLLTQPIDNATLLERIGNARNKQHTLRSEGGRAYRDADIIIREGFGL